MENTRALENAWQDWKVSSYYTTGAGEPVKCCSNCGQGISRVVVVKGPAGEVATLGVDCAERVGLSKAEVTAMIREKYYADKRAASAPERAMWAKRQEEAQAAAAVAEAKREAARVVGNVLTTLDGTVIPAKVVSGRYGLCWMLLECWGGEATGEFVSAFPKRPATMAKKGYVERTGLFHINGPIDKPWPDYDRAPVELLPVEVD